MIPTQLARALLYSLIWLSISGGRLDQWGVVAVAAALAVSTRSVWSRPSIGGLLRFIPFFVGRSLLGALDVAWRVLHPGLRVSPGFIRYRPCLLSGEQELFVFTVALSLLPGTLSVREDDGDVLVHVLTMTSGVDATLKRLERRVAHLYGRASGSS